MTIGGGCTLTLVILGLILVVFGWVAAAMAGLAIFFTAITIVLICTKEEDPHDRVYAEQKGSAGR